MDSWWDVVFQKLGKLKYREDIVCEHKLPINFKERNDATYQRMEGLQRQDKVVWDSLGTLNSIKAAIEKIDKTKMPTDTELEQVIKNFKNS